jgi:hypothetical protein
MTSSKASTVEAYLKEIPEDKRPAMLALRKTITKNLPAGFKEIMQYGMIGYVIPHSLYPDGYHTDPKEPLPFISLAAQKNHIAVYHMGIYADPALLQWFQESYAKQSKTKLDMGKSCIRFKNPTQIPVDLIGELASRMSPQTWIDLYEKSKPR